MTQSTEIKILGNKNIPKGYTMTPVGLMRSENVFQIQKGHSLFIENNHAFEINPFSMYKIKEFGEIKDSSKTYKLNSNLPNSSTLRTTTLPSGGSDGGNWVTYAEWNSSLPIMSFTSSWTVPSAPTSNTGQLIYIWEGISPSISSYPLIQPVLQWGNNGSWGGQYWSLTNWCVLSSTEAAIMPAQLSVPVGTNLQAVIQCTGTRADGSLNYSSSFAAYPNQTLQIIEGDGFNNFGGGQGTYPAMPAINTLYEVLEVPYEVSNVNQYPNQQFVTINNIQIFSGSTSSTIYPTINWTSNTTTGATLGEHTQTFTNFSNSNGGQVNLWFESGTQYLNAAISQTFARNNCGSGSIGSQVSYSVPYGEYNSTISQIDANNKAQNDINANGQNYANAHGTCTAGVPLAVSVTNPNVNTGNIPSVSFYQGSTLVTSKSIYSTSDQVIVPPGTYNVVINQSNNQSFTATVLNIGGYSTQTGQTITFSNVVVSTGYPSIYINN